MELDWATDAAAVVAVVVAAAAVLGEIPPVVATVLFGRSPGLDEVEMAAGTVVDIGGRVETATG